MFFIYNRQRLFRKKPYNYLFNATTPVKLRVELGEVFEVETDDASSGTYSKPEDVTKIVEGSALNFTPAKKNPINGPVYINGVERGDIVIVNILDVIPEDKAWVAKIPNFGHIAYDIRWKAAHGPFIRQIRIEEGPSGTNSDGKAYFPRDNDSKPPIEWDILPFFGTIGLSPDHEAISSLTGPYVANKGCYGGNWDARDIKKGAKIYLQSYHEGGLFYVGDLHVSQGDGEWGGVACEAPGLGIFKCEVIKNKKIPYARIENEKSIIQLNNGRPVERVLDEATIWLMDWLCEDYGFEKLECVDLIATCPNLKYNVYQTVPPDHYTVGVEIHKRYLK